MKRGIQFLTGLIICLAVQIVPLKVNAADMKLSVDKASVEMPVNEGTTAIVSYTGSFDDLGIVVGNPDILVSTLTDMGNGKAVVAAVATGHGKTAIAVYQKSNPDNVVYLMAKCGLTTGNLSVEVSDGVNNTAIYSDFILKYPTVLHGKNNATMQVKSAVVENEISLNKLTVAADVLTQDSMIPGLGTFYASFYDVTNTLIERQEAYVRTNLDRTMNIVWYIPENCVTILVE